MRSCRHCANRRRCRKEKCFPSRFIQEPNPYAKKEKVIPKPEVNYEFVQVNGKWVHAVSVANGTDNK